MRQGVGAGLLSLLQLSLVSSSIRLTLCRVLQLGHDSLTRLY